MKQYRVLSPIQYAARGWNPGELVEMPDERAEKYLKERTIEAIEDAEDQSFASSDEPTLELVADEEVED